MDFNGFSQADFDVFLIDGLDGRMEALKERIRPKLESLGRHYTPALSVLTGNEMFAHVAKHARRTKNPPKDTWVAFANNPRGYKMLPHFQIGLWYTHMFIWFAVIYESPEKETFGRKLEKNIDQIISSIPEDFVWSVDHTKPVSYKHGQLSKDQLRSFFQKLQTVKKAEILCGFQIDRDEAVHMEASELLKKMDYVFNKTIPLYELLMR